MGLPETILRRLEIFVSYLKHNASIQLDLKDKLDDKKIGYDAMQLKAFCYELNKDEEGFKDLLKKPLSQAEVAVGKTVGDLVAAIVAKSLFANPAAYRAKMLERTRIGLQHVMAAHSTAPISPDLIAMTDRVDKYVDLTTTSAVQRLLGAIGSEFHKYLFSMPAVSVLNGTIGRVQQDLVDRMEE